MASDFLLSLKGGTVQVSRVPLGIAVDGNVVAIELSVKGIPGGTEELFVYPAGPGRVVDAAGNSVVYRIR